MRVDALLGLPSGNEVFLDATFTTLPIVSFST